MTASLLQTGFGPRYFTLGLVTADAVAPSFSVTPFATGIQSTTIQIRFTATDVSFPGTFYVVAVPDAATAPSVAQIQAGTDAADSAAPSNSRTITTSGQSYNITLGGLTAETAYDVYYTADDSFGNDSTPAKIDVTTTAVSSATILMISSDVSRELISQEISTDL